MQAMLLAAGFGTRLQPYTLVRPKPLFPVLDTPLLHILLDQLVQAGCTRVVVNAHYLAEQIAKAVIDRPEVILQVEDKILGTGGSLRKALPLFDPGSVLVVNGDIYHNVDLCSLLEHHLESSYPVTMAMHDYPRFNKVQIQDDRILSFAENHSKKSNTILAFTGLHVLDTEIIERIPEESFFHMIDLYKELADESKIGCKRVDDFFWRDIGTPKDYLDLHRELLTSNKNEGRRSDWHINQSSVVAEGVTLHDWGVVGAGAYLGEGVRLSRCVVWPGTKIETSQYIADAIIYPDSEYSLT
jgi:mannose-1-phosphate guanylyltransferase